MRGTDGMQEGLFTISKLDDFVPGDHPLRSIRVLVQTHNAPSDESPHWSSRMLGQALGISHRFVARRWA